MLAHPQGSNDLDLSPFVPSLAWKGLYHNKLAALSTHRQPGPGPRLQSHRKRRLEHTRTVQSQGTELFLCAGDSEPLGILMTTVQGQALLLEPSAQQQPCCQSLRLPPAPCTRLLHVLVLSSHCALRIQPPENQQSNPASLLLN